jgi:hypothetical protein
LKLLSVKVIDEADAETGANAIADTASKRSFVRSMCQSPFRFQAAVNMSAMEFVVKGLRVTTRAFFPRARHGDLEGPRRALL